MNKTGARLLGVNNYRVSSKGLLSVPGVETGLAYGVLLMNSKCVEIYVHWYSSNHPA